MTDYLGALAQGALLTPDRYNDIVAKLHAYTGLSEQYIRNSNLRIPYGRFQSELLRERGIIVGRIDSRFQTYALDRPETEPDWDATDAAIDSAFTTASNTYLRETLQFNTPLLYRANIYDLIYGDGQTWDFKHGLNIQVVNVAPDLAQAMTYNPHLKVFSGNGYFDFATPFFATVYTLRHLTLPRRSRALVRWSSRACVTSSARSPRSSCWPQRLRPRQRRRRRRRRPLPTR
jgi:carboxypeptidase C (cathepsin A)